MVSARNKASAVGALCCKLANKQQKTKPDCKKDCEVVSYTGKLLLKLGIKWL